MVGLFTLLLAVSILAVTSDQRRASSGRMVHKSGWLPSTGLAGESHRHRHRGRPARHRGGGGRLRRHRVPFDGVMSWRTATGLTGDYFGGVSYNPFVGIQQSLGVSSSTPLFYAQVEGDLDPTEVSFRLLTMETYEGASSSPTSPRSAGGRQPRLAHREQFVGPTDSVTTTILVDRLQMDWLPAAVATSLGGDAEFAGSVMVRPDDGVLADGGRAHLPRAGLLGDLGVGAVSILIASNGTNAKRGLGLRGLAPPWGPSSASSPH